jgi:Holliday junction resolvase-like predicted endonuclease
MRASEAVQKLVMAQHEMIYGWVSKKSGRPMHVVWTTNTGVIDFIFDNGRGYVVIEVGSDELGEVVFATKPVTLSRLDSQAEPEQRRWLSENLPALVRNAQGMTLAKDENLRHRWYAKFRLEPVRNTTPLLTISVSLTGSSASWSVEYIRRDGCLVDEIRAQTRRTPLRRIKDAG